MIFISLLSLKTTPAPALKLHSFVQLNIFEAILINIFGGIVRCDRVAKGVVQAAQHINIPVPVVVRLQGTNSEEAKKILDESGLNLLSATTLEDAAQKVTKAIS